MMRIFKHYIPWNLALLVIAESILVFGSVYAAHFVKNMLDGQGIYTAIDTVYPKALVIALGVVVTFYIVGLYDLGLHLKRGELFVKISTSLFMTFLLVASIHFIFPSMELHGIDYVLSLCVFLPALVSFRFVYYWAININKENVLILGVNDIARNIAMELTNGSNHGFDVLGFVAENACTASDTTELNVLGTVRDLKRIVRNSQPTVVVVALSERRGTFPYTEILDCKLQGIRIEDWPTFYEKLTGKIIIQNLRPSWLIFAEGFTRNSITITIKRMTDLVLAALGLCISLPIIACITLLTKLDSRGPVFFRQERVGENGKVFILNKFRTMIQDAEKETGPVWSQDTDPRTTRLGRILRRTGLDEIPQIFNVLKGDMSFVGPRPERPHFVAELQEKIPYYAQRLVVKPGITGWAQVRYGYGATVEDAIEKLQFDLYYIKNMSFFLDMLIILSTAHKVLFAKVALQTSPKESQSVRSSTPQGPREFSNSRECAASWISTEECDKDRHPEQRRQESETRR